MSTTRRSKKPRRRTPRCAHAPPLAQRRACPPSAAAALASATWPHLAPPGPARPADYGEFSNAAARAEARERQPHKEEAGLLLSPPPAVAPCSLGGGGAKRRRGWSLQTWPRVAAPAGVRRARRAARLALVPRAATREGRECRRNLVTGSRRTALPAFLRRAGQLPRGRCFVKRLVEE